MTLPLDARWVPCPLCAHPRVPVGTLPAHVGSGRCLADMHRRAVPMTPERLALYKAAETYRAAIYAAMRALRTPEVAPEAK